MAKRGSITINGGIFLTQRKEDLGYKYWDVGYFECDPAYPDLRIYVDGDELNVAPPVKLGAKGGTIDIRLDKGPKGSQTGVSNSNTFHRDIIQRRTLYNEDIPVDESKLDSVLRFHFGSFRPSMVKKRFFKQYDPAGKLVSPQRRDLGAIAHNVVMQFDLDDGDKLTIANGTKSYFEKLIDGSVRDRLEIDILADDSTALRYFCHCVDPGRDYYWVPNQGNPPPSFYPP